MPFNVSNPVLYYNKARSSRPGSTRTSRRRRSTRSRPTSQKIVDSGVTPYGIALKTDPWYFEHWLAKAGHALRQQRQRSERSRHEGHVRRRDRRVALHVAQRHGRRQARARAPAPTGHRPLPRGRQRAGRDDDRHARRRSARSRRCSDGPVPAREARRRRRCRVPTAPTAACSSAARALYIMNKSSPEKQAAAYEFAKYLNEPRRCSRSGPRRRATSRSTKSAATIVAARREVGARPRLQGCVRPAARRAPRTTPPPAR